MTDKNYGELQSGKPTSLLRFEHSISRLRVYNVTTSQPVWLNCNEVATFSVILTCFFRGRKNESDKYAWIKYRRHWLRWNSANTAAFIACVHSTASIHSAVIIASIHMRRRQRKRTASRMRPHLSAILFPTAEEHVTDYLVDSFCCNIYLSLSLNLLLLLFSYFNWGEGK